MSIAPMPPGGPEKKIMLSGPDLSTKVPPPFTPHPAQTVEALQQEGVDRQRAAAAEIANLQDGLKQLAAELVEAKRILKEVVAAGVLTDGFVTNAVAQSLLNQAAVAKKFLEDHP